MTPLDQAAGAMATAPGDEAGVHCASRVFAPAVGIDEDPVTGGAHCALGPFWAERLGRSTLRAIQVSERTVRREWAFARAWLRAARPRRVSSRKKPSKIAGVASDTSSTA